MMGLLFGAALLVELWEQTIGDLTRGWRGRMRRQMRVSMQIAAAEQAPIRVSVPVDTNPNCRCELIRPHAAVALAEVNSWQVFVPDIFGLVEHNGLN